MSNCIVSGSVVSSHDRLLCFGNGTLIDERGALDSVGITTKFVTMVLKDGKLVLDGRNISPNIACIRIVCHQPEGDLFPTTSNQ